MRLTSVVSSLSVLLVFLGASCASMQKESAGSNAKIDQGVKETAKSVCRIQVMVLSFDRGTIEAILKGSSLSAPVLLNLWREGKGQFLFMRNTLASSGGGKMDATKLEYLYKGTRYIGRGPNGAVSETPDYEQRNLGMTLRAVIVDGTEAKAPVITVDAAAEFVFKSEGGAASGPGGLEKYPRFGTIKASTTSRMPFGEQILLGGGAESSDKKAFLFVIGRADPIDELEKK